MGNPQEILQRYRDTVPVPVVDIARDLGLQVFMTSGLEPEESGSIRKEGESYIIYVNERHPYKRKRFTIAHEIAHFLKHRDLLDRGAELIDVAKREADEPAEMFRVRGREVTEEDRRIEREADHLAAEILMPEASFREVWEKSTTVEEVADAFEVSSMAASIRAKEVLDLDPVA